MSQKYQYRVDADDKIVWVDEYWLAFAKENGASALTEARVIGRPIWDFVAGDVTLGLFRELHRRVRSSHNPVLLPFRCDSPSLKRFMQLKIVSEEAGGLFYESVLVRVEPQGFLAALDAERPRCHSFLTMCSCCKRALLEPVGWLELEDIAARLGIFDAPEVPELRYTVCPECRHPVNNSSNDGHAA